MIVIDTSAIIAILLGEPASDKLVDIITDYKIRVMSAVSFVEATMVIVSRFPQNGRQELELLLEKLAISIDNVDKKQAMFAIEAFIRYGKGRYPAALNMGDCFSYALAKDYNAPLLFKGDDFIKTDIKIVNK